MRRNWQDDKDPLWRIREDANIIGLSNTFKVTADNKIVFLKTTKELIEELRFHQRGIKTPQKLNIQL